MKQYIISTNFSSKKLNLVCFEGNKKIQEEEIFLSDLKNNIDNIVILEFYESKHSTFNCNRYQNN